MKTPNRFVTVLALAATLGALIAATFPQYQTLALIAGTVAAVATALGRSLFPGEFPESPQKPKDAVTGVLQTVIRNAPKKD